MDIHNLKEVLKLGFEMGKVGKAAMADGKIDVADFALLMALVPHVGPAFDDISSVPAELKDMDAAERQELLEFAAAELGGVLDEPKVIERVEAALRLALAANDLVKLI